MRHAIALRSDGKEEEGVSMQHTAEAVAILKVQFEEMQAKMDDTKAELEILKNMRVRPS